MVDPRHQEIPVPPRGELTAADFGMGRPGSGRPGADTGFAIVGGDTDGFECMLDTVPIDRRTPGTIVVLRMTGKIDSGTQREMQSSLCAGLRARPRHLLIDLSGVTFCGVRAFGLLEQGVRIAAEGRIGYALCGCSPHPERVAMTLWGSAGPGRHRSVAAAVATIRAARALQDRSTSSAMEGSSGGRPPTM
ncbi:hypothetical protein PSA01_65410 [Pseudonocardia saturnea]|uniref:STAS domain-containing protein n=1 Tax=Pseudonocardia saturnea TaxID=33909 RepID=A0ABQ0S9C6_9PSEU|nr:hypothetical protein Pdca_15520 [Pseudonocardia autotrophica]GEC29512.1 hypothetical protein PSA01_65410 [Pseudonocardia saturnea]